MKSVLLMLALALLGLYLGPTLIEQADSQCDSLVAYMLAVDPEGRSSPMANGMIRAVGPIFVKKMAQERYPNLPPQVVCAGLYWRGYARPRHAATLSLSRLSGSKLGSSCVGKSVA
jgi:hypothetical protein